MRVFGVLLGGGINAALAWALWPHPVAWVFGVLLVICVIELGLETRRRD